MKCRAWRGDLTCRPRLPRTSRAIADRSTTRWRRCASSSRRSASRASSSMCRRQNRLASHLARAQRPIQAGGRCHRIDRRGRFLDRRGVGQRQRARRRAPFGRCRAQGRRCRAAHDRRHEHHPRDDPGYEQAHQAPGESSQEIGNIVELISDIAEQTNILGSTRRFRLDGRRSWSWLCGRADEVQRLAERAANATKQIEVLVRTIQTIPTKLWSPWSAAHRCGRGALLAENAGAHCRRSNGFEQIGAWCRTSPPAPGQSSAAQNIGATCRFARDQRQSPIRPRHLPGHVKLADLSARCANPSRLPLPEFRYHGMHRVAPAAA